MNGSYIETSNITEIDNSQYLTMSAWVNFSSISLADIVLEYNSFSEWAGLILENGVGGWCNTNNIMATLSNGSFAYGCTTSDLIQAGNWYHLTMVFDGTQSGNSNRLKLYVNGSEETLSFTGTIPNVTASITNGFDIGYSVFTLNGRIDETRVYNRALTSDEVQELYSLGQTKINASQETKLTDGLVGSWTFDGNHMDWSQSTAEARDQSGANQCSGSPCHGDVFEATATIGKVGQGINFDGSNDYISIAPEIFDFDRLTPFSFSSWRKRIVTGGFGFIFGNFQDSLPRGLLLGELASSNRLYFILSYSDGQSIMVYSTDTLPGNDEYHFITYTYDGSGSASGVNIYVNGVLQTMFTAFDTLTLSTSHNNSKRMGVAPASAGYRLEGIVDEARLYDRVLTQDEISQLYMMGK